MLIDQCTSVACKQKQQYLHSSGLEPLEDNGCGEDNAGADGPHDGRGSMKSEKCTIR